MYTESIEKLKAVLSAMQNMSEKRGKLEKRLRHQLETEIRTLRGKSAEDRGPPGDEPSQKAWEQEARIAALEADVAKVGARVLLCRSRHALHYTCFYVILIS